MKVDWVRKVAYVERAMESLQTKELKHLQDLQREVPNIDPLRAPWEEGYDFARHLRRKLGLRFDLVLMIMCDFCALSPIQRRGILSLFHKILKPCGSVLLDVYSRATFDQREEAAVYEVNLLNGFWSPNKYYGFLNTFRYDEEKVVLDKYTIVESHRTRTVYNWLQYFAAEELEREFMEGSFSIEALYSDVAGTPYDRNSSEFAVIGKRLNPAQNSAMHSDRLPERMYLPSPRKPRRPGRKSTRSCGYVLSVFGYT